MSARALLLIVCAALVTPSAASAAGDAGGPPQGDAGAAAKKAQAGAGDDDGFADVDVTPVVTVPVGQGGSKSKGAPALSAAQLAGRLHPMLVHLPIGWLLLLLLVELWALRASGDGGERLARLLLAGTVAVCLPAVVSGLLRADTLPPDAAVVDHRNLMLAFSALLSVALPLRWIGCARPLPRWRRLAVLLLLLAALGVLIVGGHLGGELVRGEAYLPF